jgi:hypothetical protein
MEQFRQGDILLVAVNEILPENLQHENKIILAEGELTGHHHVLTAPEVYDWSVNGQRYVRVHGDTGTISHQEHDIKPAKVIPSDVTFRVIRQSEWNLKDQWRHIQD